MMRKYLKYFSSLILVPFTRWYLQKERKYSYENITVVVKPGVFHPGMFYSTKFLLSYLKSQHLDGKKLIEVGCGSGLISVWAARQNANVTAIDISQLAIDNTLENAQKNNAGIAIIQSDLFSRCKTLFFQRPVPLHRCAEVSEPKRIISDPKHNCS